MNEKQMIFCLEYLKDLELNGTAAYMKAYGTDDPKSARVQASKLLKQPKIQEYIGAVLKKVEKDSIADIEEVMEYLTTVMRGKDEEKTILMKGKNQVVEFLPPMTRDKIKAAELLGKRLGLEESDLKVMATKARLEMEQRRLELQEIKEKGDTEMLEKLDSILGAIDDNV